MAYIPFELILMVERHTTTAFWGLSVVDNPWFMIEPFKWEDMLLEFLILDLGDPVRAEKILCHLENSKTRLTVVKQLELHFYFKYCMPHLQKALPSLRRAYYLTHITDEKGLEESESYGRDTADKLAESLDVLVYSRLIKTGQSDFVMREGDADLPDYI
ncbi:hypothetical protein A0H81_15013 [Grifola frondosa]|uniref:Uncharacterized protein n=1 Tax=Grifola frondosa TaxID=5627 RepID=A0A1C7LJH8_GRIFR|nr:hypothetical protein A0H81_15013 [Grifola frondosa]